MGTNYWGIPKNLAEVARENYDVPVGHHLGKMSAGWRFLACSPNDFGVPREGKDNWPGWIEWLEGFDEIIDEYGAPSSARRLIGDAFASSQLRGGHGRSMMAYPAGPIDMTFIRFS